MPAHESRNRPLTLDLPMSHRSVATATRRRRSVRHRAGVASSLAAGLSIVVALVCTGLAGSAVAAYRAPSSTKGKATTAARIAFFSAGTSNSYLQAGISAARQEAKELHAAKFQVFDGQFSGSTQFDQIQVALASGQYNAFVVEPNDGSLVCNILTKQAAAKHVVVAIFNEPICGRATKLGAAVWQPGTVTFVGGQTHTLYEQWMKFITKTDPQGGQTAVISGPSLNANTENLDTSVSLLTADRNFKVVANQKTDYTTSEGFTTAQSIIQAHPSLKVIISNYSGVTEGIVRAVRAAGKLGKIKIFDMGGNGWATDAVKSGEITSTVVFLPRTEAATAVKAAVGAVHGKTFQHFVNLEQAPYQPLGTPFITKANVAKFKPQYS